MSYLTLGGSRTTTHPHAERVIECATPSGANPSLVPPTPLYALNLRSRIMTFSFRLFTPRAYIEQHTYTPKI